MPEEANNVIMITYRKRLRVSRRLAIVVLLCSILMGAGLAAAQHDCTDSAHHDSDHCALCTFASSAAEHSPIFEFAVQHPISIPTLIGVELPSGFLPPPSSDPRAPPSLIV